MFGAPEGMDACETGGDDFVLQNSDVVYHFLFFFEGFWPFIL